MPGPDVAPEDRRSGRYTKLLALLPVIAVSVCATHYTAHMTTPTPKSLGRVLHVAANVPAGAASTAPSFVPGLAAMPSEIPSQIEAAPAKPIKKPHRGASNRAHLQIDTSMTPFGVPTVALAAFKHAATVIDGVDRGCHMPWQFLASIGREESGDGLGDGNVLTTQGIDVPGIYGPVLNGSRKGLGAIPDSDNGRLDGNKRWDRAVGPMQFIPSTWAVVGVDGDGDGIANPQDINDAALSAAVYLCSDGADLGTPQGLREGAFRYNHSKPYVRSVMAILKQYDAGRYVTVADAKGKKHHKKKHDTKKHQHADRAKTKKDTTKKASEPKSTGPAAPTSSAPVSTAPAASPTTSPAPSSAPSSTPSPSPSPSSGGLPIIGQLTANPSASPSTGG